MLQDYSLLKFTRIFKFTIVIILSIVCSVKNVFASVSPYPPSSAITGVTWDTSSTIVLCPGSDNWPITWADDGHQYTIWGDGGGFGGTNDLGRVSLGFARVEGEWNSYQGINVWGGYNTENPAQFWGKSYGIISVNGVLYAWWGPGSTDFINETRVLTSTDKSKTWTKSNWRWTNADNLYGGSFLNFGKDNAGARDNYVYSYFPRGSSWGLHEKADLVRVPKDQIMDQSAYEWFAGLDNSGNPTWTNILSARQPVFQDPNGLRTVSVTYNPGLGRYLLTSQHSLVGMGSGTNQWGLFEGPEPWGPWKTIDYYTLSDNWGNTQGVISFYFAPKWFSADGKDFTLVYSHGDNWGTVRGRFTTNAPQDITPPTIPQNLNAIAQNENQINLTWAAASDPESGISKYNIYRDGANVGQSTTTSFSDTGLNEGTTYNYEVSAVNGDGMEGTKSAPVSAKTLADALPPTISSVSASGVSTKVTVVFSEPVEQASATNASNYIIDNVITVSTASLGSDLKTVTLATGPHTLGVSYTLTVNNIKDRASTPNVIAKNTIFIYAVALRVVDGLTVFYDFSEGAGNVIMDKSGIGPSIDLTIESGVVNWLQGRNGIEIASSSVIKNVNPTKLYNKLTATNRLTIEAWIEPANLTQGGPARIVTLSNGKSTNAVNVHLGQQDTQIIYRTRISGSDYHELSVPGGFINTTSPRHVVITFDGLAKSVYFDGQLQSRTEIGVGGFSTWDTSFPLILGNENNVNRAWLGKMYMIAIYDKALVAEDVMQNYMAGSNVSNEVDTTPPASPTGLTVE